MQAAASKSLSPNDAARLYADHLKSKSWCVNVSSFPAKALHITSNEECLIESFRYDFPAWAKAKGVRVDTNNYADFLKTLTDRLIYLLPRVNGVSFKPVPDPIFSSPSGLKYANTYVPFRPDVPSEFEMPEILTEYLDRVFMNDQDRKFVIQWLADIIQNPLRRPQWAICITGLPGTGKSSIYRLVKAALGGRYVWNHNTYDSAFKQFSEVLPNHLLVAFDDAPAGSNTYELLKLAITCSTREVEIKGEQKRVSREVFARILVCSNDVRPLSLDESDRRFYCTEYSTHKIDPEETAAFFVRFNEWIESPDTPAIIYHWLMNVDLSDFKPGSTIQTPTHAAMVGLSTSVFERCLKDFISADDGESPVFLRQTLLRHLSQQGFKNPNLDSIKLKMDKLGYEESRRVVKGCNYGKKVYLWQLKPKNSVRAPSLTPEQEERICEEWKTVTMY
jgi:hypothetical protein